MYLPRESHFHSAVTEVSDHLRFRSANAQERLFTYCLCKMMLQLVFVYGNSCSSLEHSRSYR